jgi:hypothetical protein
MNDLVRESGEITNFKRSAYADPSMSFSMEVQHNVNNLYDSREDNAKLLVRVIVWDLNQNEGKAGIYFSFFTHKMSTLDADSRKLIADVIDQVKEGVKHNTNHADEKEVKSAFEDRLEEIINY